ncbi:hypothetical protein [uncultured Flavobacterium sp.]|uniref:hypothetical protein n=1 Tax=uncultured Flavobacterium sp. TaxID=165435 RepID=UPI0030816E6E
MKKLKLKNLKVVQMTKEEKKTIAGGSWPTSGECNRTSGPYVSWCHGCEQEPAQQ